MFDCITFFIYKYAVSILVIVKFASTIHICQLMLLHKKLKFFQANWIYIILLEKTVHSPILCYKVKFSFQRLGKLLCSKFMSRCLRPGKVLSESAVQLQDTWSKLVSRLEVMIRSCFCVVAFSDSVRTNMVIPRGLFN